MEIYFILVEPKVPGNIGASARAMKTMGFFNLRLVHPVEDHLHEKSRILAHGSNDILEKTQVFKSLEEAIKDIDFIIGTSAKDRRVNTKVYPVNSLKKVIDEKKGSIKSIAIVFGREESGLTNDEIDLCDIVSYVSMYNQYPSLNLSQAVMVYAHNLFLDDIQNIHPRKADTETSSYKELKEKIVSIFKEIEVDKNPALYGRLVERLASINDEDVHLLHSLIKYYLKRNF